MAQPASPLEPVPGTEAGATDLAAHPPVPAFRRWGPSPAKLRRPQGEVEFDSDAAPPPAGLGHQQEGRRRLGFVGSFALCSFLL